MRNDEGYVSLNRNIVREKKLDSPPRGPLIQPPQMERNTRSLPIIVVNIGGEN